MSEVTTVKRVVLPKVVTLRIGAMLDFKDNASLASSSKYSHGIFQPELDVSRLLSFVVQGHQDQANSMLGRHPELLLMTADVTDYSARSFKKITAYEYAYWAKDTHMDDETKAEMLKPIDNIEVKGLSYEQDGIVVEHSKHFDFNPLIICPSCRGS